MITIAGSERSAYSEKSYSEKSTDGRDLGSLGLAVAGSVGAGITFVQIYEKGEWGRYNWIFAVISLGIALMSCFIPKKTRYRAIAVTCTVVIVLAGLYLYENIPQARPACATEPGEVAPLPRSQPVNPAARFSSPEENCTAGAGASVAITGTARDLGSKNTILIFRESSLTAGTQTIVDKQAARTDDGDWNVSDTIQGDEAQQEATITYRAVAADAECLESLRQNSSPIRGIPSGCSTLDTVAIKAH